MPHWEPIPGETPIDDVSGLIPKGIRTRRDLNIAEADNIRRAITRYLLGRPTRRQAPFSLSWLYKLHADMLGRVWRWAGSRRTVMLNLGVPAHQVEMELQKMLDDLAVWRETGMDVFEQAARLHHRAVSIHPFLNGNGRWARMLANIWLRQQRHGYILWPEEAVGNTSPIRAEYLNAVKAADRGAFEALIALHRKYAHSTA